MDKFEIEGFNMPRLLGFKKKKGFKKSLKFRKSKDKKDRSEDLMSSNLINYKEVMQGRQEFKYSGRSERMRAKYRRNI